MSQVVMSGKLTSRVVMVSVLLALLRGGAAVSLVGACNSAARPPPELPAASTAASSPVPPEAPLCVDAKDERVQCLSDADCCPRFVCGKDPELSQSVNYCIFGG